MHRKQQTSAEARAELALNLRSFAGSWLVTGDELRLRLMRVARAVPGETPKNAAITCAKAVADALDHVLMKPLATRAVRASAVVLGAAPLSFKDAYAEALLISQWGPSIPESVRQILRTSENT